MSKFNNNINTLSLLFCLHLALFEFQRKERCMQGVPWCMQTHMSPDLLLWYALKLVQTLRNSHNFGYEVHQCKGVIVSYPCISKERDDLVS